MAHKVGQLGTFSIEFVHLLPRLQEHAKQRCRIAEW